MKRNIARAPSLNKNTTGRVIYGEVESANFPANGIERRPKITEIIITRAYKAYASFSSGMKLVIKSSRNVLNTTK